MEKTRKNILIINIILLGFILLGDALFMFLDVEKSFHIVIKSLTSSLFVILGFINFCFTFKDDEANKFSKFLLSGLFFAMLGDIILEIEFMIGAILFAVGHVFYFISFSNIVKFKFSDLIYGAIIFVPSVLFITLAPIFNFDGVLMEIVCVVYAIIISCMVGKSISNVVALRNKTNVTLVIGSLLFFFSDLMLLLNVFGSMPKIVSFLCLITYYPAQFLLAFSIFLIGYKKALNNNDNKFTQAKNND